MKLDCFLIEGGDLDIRPASNRRDWMDATPERFAYRCLPLSIANAHGWVIGCDGGFEAEWKGGPGAHDVKVIPAGDGPVTAEGHFGSGILTLQTKVIFRTEPGYNLWVSGPPNSFKDGIHPLSAVVESDWIPFPFTMNWKITRPDHRIRFAKGEPYCFLFPVKRGVPDSAEPVIKPLADDPELKAQYEYGHNMRSFLENVQYLKTQEGKMDPVADEKALRFQKWYMAGRMPDGSRVFPEHQKSLELQPFKKEIDPTES
jgi:hypothetical protein